MSYNSDTIKNKGAKMPIANKNKLCIKKPLLIMLSILSYINKLSIKGSPKRQVLNIMVSVKSFISL